MTEEVQPNLDLVTEEKPKLSENRLEALKRAREKANSVRRANAEERKKSKEIEKAAIETTKKANSERIQREYDALVSKPEEVQGEEEVQEEDEIVYSHRRA